MASTTYYYLSFIIITIELMLLMYILMLQPNLHSNRLFALYMLVLAIGSFSSLVSNTAVDFNIIYDAARIRAISALAAPPLLWLILFCLFIPRHRLTSYLLYPLMIASALPILLGAVDMLWGLGLFFGDPSAVVGNQYIALNEIVNGRFGTSFYYMYLVGLDSLIVLPIGYFAFSKMLAPRLRHAARVLFFFLLVVGLLFYTSWLNLPPDVMALVTPILSALGTAWVVSRYGFFWPMEAAMKQVVDTITIGLLVFDEQLQLLDANAFALKILAIDLPVGNKRLTMQQLLHHLMERAENSSELANLQKAIQDRPNRLFQQEVVLQNGRSSRESEKIWTQLTIRPIYNQNNLYIGAACTIEDLTIERRTQGYITEAHKAIEQYAYNQALLNDITQAAISAFNFDENLTDLASRLAGLFAADHCYISIWDEDLQQPKPAVAYGGGTENFLLLPLNPGEPSLGEIICRQHKPVAIEDLKQSKIISPKVAQLLPSRGLLGLPMIVNEKILGSLVVGFTEPRVFTEEELRWGEQIARQMALAIFKNHLLAVEQEQRIFLEALQSAGQALISTLDFEQVIDRILYEIERVVPYDTANFALIRHGEAHIVRKRDFDDFRQVVGDIFRPQILSISQLQTLKIMYESKRPLLVPNTSLSPVWTDEGHIKSWIGVPLVFEGEPIAFLMLDKLEPDYYQPQHEKWLTAFADQATLALQHARYFTEIQRRITELEALSNVSAALRSSDSVPLILQSVLQAMVRILPAKVGVAFLMNETQTAVVSQASYPPGFYPKGLRYSLGQGITGHVAQTGQTYITQDILDDPRAVRFPQEPEDIADLRATIALPLISEDQCKGVIHLGLDQNYDFAEDEIRTLEALSDIVANGLQRIHIMQTLEARVASRTYDLEMAYERLQELDKLKTKFIADISHELRTPIANLSIYIDLLQNGSPDKKDRYISILQQQANRLTNLVEATLGLSQLEIGARVQELGPVTLNQLVEESILSHQARVEAFGLILTHSLYPNLPPILGDKIQLDQLITNLITNAIHYNQEGGRIVVETGVADDNRVYLKVEDNGMGIAEEDLPHLFDRFYRGQRAGQSNIPGTGLGLSIVKGIVDLHQGEIQVSSMVNEGTTFSVLLPVYQAEDSTAALHAKSDVG